tara:strand:- start:1534 stop:2340 length:807 start_codon:yes stop_codon:yes gene_type:complete
MAIGEKINFSPLKQAKPPKGLSGMAIGGIASAVTGVAGGLFNYFGGRKARNEAEEQRKEAQGLLNEQIADYQDLDTSNIYANVRNPYASMETEFENVYEDLTVNQQQARFMAEQGAQQRANIMQNLSGAAGGSGIAALAQTMANQGQLAAQQASASIGQQEAANQMAAARGAASVQQMEAAREQQILAGEAQAEKTRLAGEEAARGLEYQKTQSMMELRAGQLQSAVDAKLQAQQQMSSGISDILGGVTGGLSMFAMGGGFGKPKGNR